MEDTNATTVTKVQSHLEHLLERVRGACMQDASAETRLVGAGACMELYQYLMPQEEDIFDVLRDRITQHLAPLLARFLDGGPVKFDVRYPR